MNNEEFREWLVNQMDAKGMSIQELAKETGLSRQAITYYVNGYRTPTLDSFGLILGAMKKRIQIIDN